MAREDIVKQFVTELKAMKTVKLGRVQRDPIIISELPKTGFPAVYVETTDEDRENITMGPTRLMRSMVGYLIQYLGLFLGNMKMIK